MYHYFCKIQKLNKSGESEVSLRSTKTKQGEEMTHQNNYNLSAEKIEEISRDGLEAVPEMLRVLLNNIM